jgi:hypothetical protein
MNHLDSIYKEIEKVNGIIEDCYNYLKKSTHRNQERIKSLLDRTLKLRDHYLSKLRRVAEPTHELNENVNFHVQEQYSRTIGF